MRIAICDEKNTERERISDYLKEFDSVTDSLEIFDFSNGEALLDSYKNGNRYDLVFLNAEMKDLSGIETGKQIRELDCNVLILFMGDYNQNVLDAFQLNAFQFIKKPLKQEIFIREMHRAKELLGKNKNLYSIRNRDTIETLEIKDILYINILIRDVYIHTLNGVYEKKGKLRDEIERLEGCDFVQYYKGGIVNLHNIKRITGDEIYLKTGEKLLISRGFKTEVKSKFDSYLRKSSV